jgi:hypothetical protein
VLSSFPFLRQAVERSENISWSNVLEAEVHATPASIGAEVEVAGTAEFASIQNLGGATLGYHSLRIHRAEQCHNGFPKS